MTIEPSEWEIIIKPFEDWFKDRDENDWFIQHRVISQSAKPICEAAYLIGLQHGLKVGEQIAIRKLRDGDEDFLREYIKGRLIVTK